MQTIGSHSSLRSFPRVIKSSLPELPDQKRARFIEQYDIPSYDAGVLTADRSTADFFESCIDEYDKPKVVSNWIMTEVLRELKSGEDDLSAFSITPQNLAELLKIIDDGTISGKMAKEIFAEMVTSKKKASEIVSEKGIQQISDSLELENIIKQIVIENPNEVERFKQGEKKLQGFFVGRVMKATGGKANPKKVNELLIKILQN